VLAVATHTIVRGASVENRPSADEEVNAIARWIRDHEDRVERGERPITFRELRRILGTFRFALENPNNNSIDLVKIETEKGGFLRPTATTVRKRIGSIGFPGDTKIVPVRTIKYVRQQCRLREEDGVDSAAFYDDVEVVDAFINEYRNVLRRLARR